jgi:hypothetical protein
MTVFDSRFSGAVTVKIVGKIDENFDFFSRKDTFRCISTSRTNRTYPKGTIIDAMGYDLFDTYSINRTGFFTYKGKDWKSKEYPIIDGISLATKIQERGRY